MNEPAKTTGLNDLCMAFRRRLRLLLAGAGVARVVCLGILLFAGLLVLDWRLHLETPYRVAALLAFLTALAAVAWYTLARPLRSRWSDAEVLAHIDSVDGAGRGMLLDSYELATAGTHIQELESEQGRLLAETARTNLTAVLSQVQLRSAFDSRRLLRWLTTAGLLALLLLIVGLVLPNHLAIGSERLFNPFARTRWPHRTTIAVERPDTGWTVPQLESFTINAAVSGELPERIVLAYRSGSSGPWTREKLALQATTMSDDQGNSRISHTVRHTFPEVREPLEFTLEGGDYQTDRYALAVIQRPYVQKIIAHYSYPAYVGIPDRTQPGGQLSGLEGTQVRLVLESSMALDRMVLVLTPEEAGVPPQRLEPRPVSDTTFEHTFLLERNARYSIELYEKNGYREARPESYDIRVIPDDPPEIEMLSPGKDLVQTRQASVAVAFRVRDRLGLAKVEFLYQVDDNPPVVLSDRVTGPIPQRGTESSARFSWELRRLDVPESGAIRYFVRAQDNNPTGRGRVESPAGQIKLVKSSEFHLESLERAKALEEEARIAWRNQLQAWRLAEPCRDKGTGAEDDPLWVELGQAQQKAFLATRQMQLHLQDLSERYQRNHLGPDFMAARLSVIAGLVQQLGDKEYAAIAEGLAAARPRSAADAAPDRLKGLRAAAIAKFQDQQKMAVLILERVLRKLYDWRDLQTCTVTAKLLQEHQEDVLGRTQVVAPKTIAKEIEDLSEKDQETVLTLGKQQRAIFDSESGLENQLTYLLYKAERQGRKAIQAPLQAAFGNLRNHRVNHHLKRAAELIENNQPGQIIDDQKAAVRALQVVQAGLIAAGQKVERDDPLVLAMSPSNEAQFDPDLVKPPDVAQKPDDPKTVSPTETPTTELPVLAEGTDTLSAALRLAIEHQDSVLGRTRYLDKNRGPEEMPRFVRLRLQRLAERQQAALEALEQASAEADKKQDAIARSVLVLLREDLEPAKKLIAALEIGAGTQQIEADAIETLKGLLQHLALVRASEDGTAENRRLGGMDAFNRKYLLRDKDLEAALAILVELSHARLLQADVLRKLERFQKQPAAVALLASIETNNRQRAAAVQSQVAKLIDGVTARVPSFSTEVAAKAQQTGIGRLSERKPSEIGVRLAAGKADAELIVELRTLVQALDASLLALRDLLEERVRTEPATAVVQDAQRMTQEQFQQATSRENLARLLKDEKNLPPDVRERMLRALEKDFPPKYRELLQAFYGSFVTPRKEPKE